MTVEFCLSQKIWSCSELPLVPNCIGSQHIGKVQKTSKTSLGTQFVPRTMKETTAYFYSEKGRI